MLFKKERGAVNYVAVKNAGASDIQVEKNNNAKLSATVNPPSPWLLQSSPLDFTLSRLKLQQLGRKVQPKGQESVVVFLNSIKRGGEG